jgi:hypothetical protein
MIVADFKPAAVVDGYSYSIDTYVQWHCPCGVREFALDEDNEETTCSRCGRRYRLVSYLEVQEP